jgi:hypothetical protein
LDLPASIDVWTLYYYILAGIGLFIVCLSVWENAEMPENYRLMMDFEYQGEHEEIHKLKYIVFEISIKYIIYYIS